MFLICMNLQLMQYSYFKYQYRSYSIAIRSLHIWRNVNQMQKENDRKDLQKAEVSCTVQHCHYILLVIDHHILNYMWMFIHNKYVMAFLSKTIVINH